MTVLGIVKVAKLALWVVGGIVVGLVLAAVSGTVRDKEVLVIFCGVIAASYRSVFSDIPGGLSNAIDPC